MTTEKTEGLLLQSIPYLGKKKILKILTKEKGLITLITKKSAFESLTTPFLIAEWIYFKTSKEIYPLLDASLLENLAPLRTSFATITAAGTMAKIVLNTTLAEKSNPLLYDLSFAYFRKVPSFTSHDSLIASFQLKLLLLEGLLALQPTCSLCKEQALILNDGESFCRQHAQDQRVIFSLEEWELLHTLAFARQFQQLRELIIGKSMKERIDFLFSQRI